MYSDDEYTPVGGYDYVPLGSTRADMQDDGIVYVVYEAGSDGHSGFDDRIPAAVGGCATSLAIFLLLPALLMLAMVI